MPMDSDRQIHELRRDDPRLRTAPATYQGEAAEGVPVLQSKNVLGRQNMMLALGGFIGFVAGAAWMRWDMNRKAGELCWADLGPSYDEHPMNPNPICFSLVRIVPTGEER
jgi:hypothetical protein